MNSLELLCLTVFAFQTILITDLIGWPLKRLFYRYVYLKLPHWKRFSRAARMRQNNMCQVRGCDQTTRIGVHHKHYRSLRHEKFSDVVVLCWGHHKAIESGTSYILRDGTVLEGKVKRRKQH